MTEAWQVILSREPKKILDKVPADLRRRILARLHELESDARPTGPKKLTGYTDLYRVRVGDWRITYAIKDAELIVLVMEMVQSHSETR